MQTHLTNLSQEDVLDMKEVKHTHQAEQDLETGTKAETLLHHSSSV